MQPPLRVLQRQIENVALLDGDGPQGRPAGRHGQRQTQRQPTLAEFRFSPYHDEITSGEATLVVKTEAASDPVETLGENEAYHLEITPTHALLTAPNPLGAMHGLADFSATCVDHSGWIQRARK